MSNAFIQMSGVFAELELGMIRERVKSGMANAKGVRIGRPELTKDYNQVKRVCKLACEQVNADCSTSVSAALKHSTSCHRSNGDARKEYIYRHYPSYVSGELNVSELAHVYACTVEKIVDRSQKVRALLDKYGFEKTESILNEWNYVKSWDSGNIQYSYATHSKIKGASFTLAAMCACQSTPVDMLMYYDARPNTVWNGMFDMTHVERSTLAGYYPFPMFNALYQLGNQVESVINDASVYVCAARGEDEAGVILTHYNDDDATEAKTVTVDLKGLGGRTEAEIYLLDDDHRLTLTQKLTFTGDLAWEIEVPNFTCYLILLKKKKHLIKNGKSFDFPFFRAIIQVNFGGTQRMVPSMKDLTSGNIHKNFFLFSIPIILLFYFLFLPDRSILSE